ncbi:MAG: hypothetical protein V4487_08830 [Chlamydiota bacterium]
MTNSISWGQIATNVNECVHLANDINQAMQNLNTAGNTIAQDEADAQALRALVSGQDLAFSGICSADNIGWVNFQSGFTAALNQTLANFTISVPVTINGQVQNIATNSSGQPLTLANYDPTASINLQFTLPFTGDEPTPTVTASYFSAAQQSAINADLFQLDSNYHTSVTSTTDGLTFSGTRVYGGSTMTINLSYSASMLAANLSVVPNAAATQPLLSFLAANL